MATTAVMLRRSVAGWMTVLACLTLATTTGRPVAHAEGRDQLAQAIATTRGGYLVYNGFPAPMLNGAGNWYEMTGNGAI